MEKPWPVVDFMLVTVTLVVFCATRPAASGSAGLPSMFSGKNAFIAMLSSLTDSVALEIVTFCAPIKSIASEFFAPVHPSAFVPAT